MNEGGSVELVVQGYKVSHIQEEKVLRSICIEGQQQSVVMYCLF
jgi:hypothetical protein